MELKDERVCIEINIDRGQLTHPSWSYYGLFQNMIILTSFSVKVYSKKPQLQFKTAKLNVSCLTILTLSDFNTKFYRWLNHTKEQLTKVLKCLMDSRVMHRSWAMTTWNLLSIMEKSESSCFTQSQTNEWMC